MGEKILEFLSQYIIALISVTITGVLFWAFSPDDTVSIKVFMCFVIPLGLYAIITIPQQVNFWYTDNTVINLPHLKLIKDNRHIFEPSELFSSQAAVSLYIKDDIERYIGFGKIETIISQSNNLQVVISEIEKQYTDDFLIKNRKNIILKPTIPYQEIEKLRIYHSKGDYNG